MPSAAPVEGTPAWGWAVLRAAALHARSAQPREPGPFALGADGRLQRVAAGAPDRVLERGRAGEWVSVGAPSEELAALLDLYLPVCAAGPSQPCTIAHLGQSLDGHIATSRGDSSYVNGPQNILHLHRMRALCDAIVVGAGTIAADDPRLTARLAGGASPARVILDPRRRLEPCHRVFNDGEAETLLVCASENAAAAPAHIGAAQVLPVPCASGRLDLAVLLERLHERGLYSVFVEGGGTTVSRFLERGLLDRLQIAVAPLVIGHGRAGLRLPARARIAEALRPRARVFAMGADILFDCDLRAPAAAERAGARVVARIY